MSDSIVFDRAAAFYDATRGFPPGVEQDVAATITTHARLSRESRVLEIGVGTGRIALPLSRYVGSYIGVDLSRPMMDVLRQKQAGEPIALVEGDATQLPFAAPQFDLALAIHVFHLIPSWRAVVTELGRVVRPGGAVLINHFDPPSEIIQQWLHFLERHGVRDHSRIAGVRDITIIGDALAAEGFATREEGVAAEWTQSTRPLDTLDNLAQRIWSSTWEIPGPAFSHALADLRAWLHEHYRDPGESTEESRNFRYTLFRKDPS